MQEKVGEQGRLISPCLKAGALRHILVNAVESAHRYVETLQLKPYREECR